MFCICYYSYYTITWGIYFTFSWLYPYTSSKSTTCKCFIWYIFHKYYFAIRR